VRPFKRLNDYITGQTRRQPGDKINIANGELKENTGFGGSTHIIGKINHILYSAKNILENY
jgi:hypothetical protein